MTKRNIAFRGLGLLGVLAFVLAGVGGLAAADGSILNRLSAINTIASTVPSNAATSTPTVSPGWSVPPVICEQATFW